jgi:UDP-GlcNAc:undecaprenyl-phosphate GlcNAc-1-phosphate transferase
MKTYLSVYLGSVFLALVITPAVIWVAKRIKAVDRPGVRSVHERPIPRIGGMAIFLPAMSLFIAVLFLSNPIGAAFRGIPLQITTLFCTATFIFVIGLVDDLRRLPARFKFLAEIVAALVLCSTGVRIANIGVTDAFSLHLGGWGWPLTVLWIVGITNAVNLSDGLDGLAAGVSAIACGVIAVLAIHGGQVVMAVLMLALMGSLTGFLYYNFNPASIFMGDCGSLFLGFMIASSSVLYSMKSSALVGLALPFLALGVPIFDTLFSMLRRFLEQRSMFAPDRRHFHHKLIDLGLKQRHVVILIYMVTLTTAGLGMFMMVARNGTTLTIFFCILMLLVVTFRMAGPLRLKGTIVAVQKKYQLSSQRERGQRIFEHAQLCLHNARNPREWWATVCETAEHMDLAWVSVKTRHKEGRIDEEIWRAPRSEPTLSRIITVTIPLGRNGNGAAEEFEFAISADGSLEEANHRATLFGRLIDEHAVAGSIAASV